MKKLAYLRRLNFPLLLGSLLLILLIITSIYPDQLATADPYGKQRLEFQSDANGQSTFVIPPGGLITWEETSEALSSMAAK